MGPRSRFRSCSWPSLAALLAVSQLQVPASAQVSGDIVVGRAAIPLAALAPLAEGPAAEDAAGEVASGEVPAVEGPIGGRLAEPRLVELPQTVYPRAARAARQEGQVTVCFAVDERGRVQMPAVRASTDSVFNQAAIDAIRAARFTPARVGAQPVRSTACRTFRFELR